MSVIPLYMETKLRLFQFKFLHRRIATDDFLCKIGIKQVDSCSFCGETTETLVFGTANIPKHFGKNYLNRVCYLNSLVLMEFLLNSNAHKTDTQVYSCMFARLIGGSHNHLYLGMKQGKALTIP